MEGSSDRNTKRNESSAAVRRFVIALSGEQSVEACRSFHNAVIQLRIRTAS